MQLSEAESEFAALGVRLVAMSYDPVATNKKFSGRSKVSFPILSDEGASHVRRFGILNEAYEPGHRWYGIPHPGIFVVDASGHIFSKLAEERYQDRPAIPAILEATRAMLARDMQ